MFKRRYQDQEQSAAWYAACGTAFSNKPSHQTLGSVLRIIARCRWFEEDLGSEVVFGFLAHVHDRTPLPILLRRCRKVTGYFDFGIRPGMGTCGHDTSRQFGERLLVHVKEYDANGWRDCVQ